MAGGKETPRQKLIGLMYLVLLALLALQVSSAIMQKFQFLNSSLELALRSSVNNNDGIISRIQAAVDKTPKYAPVLEEAKKVKDLSRKMISEINDWKTKITYLKLDQKDSAKTDLKEEEPVAQIMIGSGVQKQAGAYKLKESLDKYVSELNKIGKANFKDWKDLNRLALDGKEDPLAMNDPEQKGKDFAELNFESTPMIAAIAVLSDKQSRIASYEADVLSRLSLQVGAKDFKVGAMTADYSALSSTVAAGTDYEAKLFLSAKLDVVPTMTFKGSAVKVEDGVGKIKFKAAASTFDKDGNAKQTWEGKITVAKPSGEGDTTFIVKGEYTVAKPVIDVKSASVGALYYNCGNDLNIQVPALGANYKPSFKASNANVINGKDKGAIIVIPTIKGADAKVTISVSSDGASIGSKEFPVRGVPRPQIVAKIGGSPVNQKTGVPAPGPASIQVAAEPDPGFLAALPKEARYNITDGEVTLARGKREITTLPIRSDNVNLASIRSQAQSGDRIIIVIKKARRLNFRDESEEVPINPSASVITIPIN
jgi:gliding motility-associated protein GldM